mmetsp:Transcript_36262/g.116157  ORF Transcript_36262/g.116157 Transcript_36262/m.116157 type:complete len:314 (+) Transcript_36262:263-1204(+)
MFFFSLFFAAMATTMATAVSKKSVRVVQYNVNRFKDFEAVAAALEKLRPNIVALNEVDVTEVPGCLERLAAKLNLTGGHFFFGHARSGTYGNALLCDRPCEVAQTQHLRGGAVVTFGNTDERHHVVRGLLVVKVKGLFSVAVTHLDHVDEDERATQATSLLEALEQGESSSRDVLLIGDLNALRKADYAPDHWDRLRARNDRKGWRPPADSAEEKGALGVLANAGYVDLALLRGDPPHMTSLAHCDLRHDETACGTIACQRIDYAFASPNLAKKVAHCQVSADSSALGSDHFPLLVDLTIDDGTCDGTEGLTD